RSVDNIIYSEAVETDAEELAEIMRPDDKAEVTALGFTPLSALKDSLSRSRYAYAARHDGQLLGIVGVGDVSVIGNRGCIWLLTSIHAEKMAAKRALVRTAPRVIASFMEEYDVLFNYVDVRYQRALRWLKHIGF